MVSNLMKALKTNTKAKPKPTPSPSPIQHERPVIPTEPVADPDHIDPVPEADVVDVPPEVGVKITSSHLHSLGVKTENVAKYLAPLNSALIKYSIDTPLKVAHFLAQVLHESGCLKYTEELASGDKYEGRADLGNTHPGDGKLFKGRGFIQITGRSNYMAYGKHISQDLVANPTKLNDPVLACDSAGWFWSVFKKDKTGKSLNAMAESDDFLRVTYFINGGTNGIEHRFSLLKIAYKLFGVSDFTERVEKFKNYAKDNLTTVNRTSMQKALFASIPDLATLAKY